MKIKEKIPEALLVFVTPPTVEELERRLTGRGTETAQVIADRLARAGEEAEGMGQYDYILVNDTVEECVDHLHQIIVSEHSRASRNYGRSMSGKVFWYLQKLVPARCKGPQI